MVTAVRDSSAHSKHINDVSGITEGATRKILEYLEHRGWVTRRQIAEDTGLATATVSGLVTKMLFNTVEERSEKGPCPVTGRLVYYLRKIRYEQQELF